jgi:hypothetical protein
MTVQQELMRHADIRTAMNVCGKAMDATNAKHTAKWCEWCWLPKWLSTP